MKKDHRGLKKWVYTLIAFVLFLLLSYLTNPSKEDYTNFDESETGIPIPETARIVDSDFYFFSLYATAPENTIDEYGVVYFGFMGQFFKVSDDQFDDSVWKDLLNR